jgi:hypothetical protein
VACNLRAVDCHGDRGIDRGFRLTDAASTGPYRDKNVNRKQLIVRNLSAPAGATGEAKEYRLGFFDETKKIWELNDSLGDQLLDLLLSLGWSYHPVGFPHLEIVLE